MVIAYLLRRSFAVAFGTLTQAFICLLSLVLLCHVFLVPIAMYLKIPRKAISSAQEEVDLDSPAKSLAISAYLFNLGFLRLAVLGEYSSAAELFQQTHSLRVPLLGEEHALVVQPVVSRGWALVLTGETQLALEELMRWAIQNVRLGASTTFFVRFCVLGVEDEGSEAALEKREGWIPDHGRYLWHSRSIWEFGAFRASPSAPRKLDIFVL